MCACPQQRNSRAQREKALPAQSLREVLLAVISQWLADVLRPAPRAPLGPLCPRRGGCRECAGAVDCPDRAVDFLQTHKHAASYHCLILGRVLVFRVCTLVHSKHTAGTARTGVPGTNGADMNPMNVTESEQPAGCTTHTGRIRQSLHCYHYQWVPHTNDLRVPLVRYLALHTRH